MVWIAQRHSSERRRAAQLSLDVDKLKNFEVRAEAGKLGKTLVNVDHPGGCMCGAVRVRTSGSPLRVTVCHCKWCQRRTGTAFGTEVVFREQDVELKGQTLVRHRHISDESGRWLEVGFCGICGTNLGFTLEAAPGLRTVPAGAFDDPAWMTDEQVPFVHVFVRSKRSWGDLTATVEAFEEHFRA